jgi:hypothetical protein
MHEMSKPNINMYPRKKFERKYLIRLGHEPFIQLYFLNLPSVILISIIVLHIISLVDVASL